jgi:hypothetical protein
MLLLFSYLNVKGGGKYPLHRPNYNNHHMVLILYDLKVRYSNQYTFQSPLSRERVK